MSRITLPWSKRRRSPLGGKPALWGAAAAVAGAAALAGGLLRRRRSDAGPEPEWSSEPPVLDTEGPALAVTPTEAGEILEPAPDEPLPLENEGPALSIAQTDIVDEPVSGALVDDVPEVAVTEAEAAAAAATDERLDPGSPLASEEPLIEPADAVPPLEPTTTAEADPLDPKAVGEDPLPEAVDDPLTEVVDDPLTEVVDDPLTEVVEDPLTEVVEDPLTEVVEDPLTEAGEDPKSP